MNGKCPTGKIRYGTKGAAFSSMQAARAARKRAFRDARLTGRKRKRATLTRRETAPYYCKECAGWHLTSSKDRRI